MKKSLGVTQATTPTPVWVVCAYDENGKATGATVAWGGVCSSDPAAVAISLRPSRYTHKAILAAKAFTVNIPGQRQAPLADYFGMVSGKNHDKFADTGLTAVKSAVVNAPIIAEFPVTLECELLQVVELGVHTQFIGEIKGVLADEIVLDEKGNVNIEAFGTVIYSPHDKAYFGLGPRLGQAYSIGKAHAK